MNLVEDDVLVFLYILDHPKCTITDIIKAIYTIDDTDMLKRIDGRLRKRINLMSEDQVVVKLNGYSPVRYQANPEKIFKGTGPIVFKDSDENILQIEPGDYIAVSGPDERITICPLSPFADENSTGDSDSDSGK